jgi:hypothetical protein
LGNEPVTRLEEIQCEAEGTRLLSRCDPRHKLDRDGKKLRRASTTHLEKSCAGSRHPRSETEQSCRYKEPSEVRVSLLSSLQVFEGSEWHVMRGHTERPEQVAHAVPPCELDGIQQF